MYINSRWSVPWTSGWGKYAGNYWENASYRYGRSPIEDVSFLAFSRNHLYWLLIKGSKNLRSILCHTSNPFERRTANETTKIGAQKSRLSPWQYSHLCSRNGKIEQIKVWYATASTLASRFGFLLLLPIHKPQVLAERKEIYLNEKVIISVDEYFEGLGTSRIKIVRDTTPARHAGHVCERECSNLARTRLKAWGAYQCVAVRDHSWKHAIWSNETHRKLRYINFNI